MEAYRKGLLLTTYYLLTYLLTYRAMEAYRKGLLLATYLLTYH